MGFPCSPRDSQETSPTPWFNSILLQWHNLKHSCPATDLCSALFKNALARDFSWAHDFKAFSNSSPAAVLYEADKQQESPWNQSSSRVLCFPFSPPLPRLPHAHSATASVVVERKPLCVHTCEHGGCISWMHDPCLLTHMSINTHLCGTKPHRKVKALVPPLYPTLCDPMDRSPPGSSVHGIL